MRKFEPISKEERETWLNKMTPFCPKVKVKTKYRDMINLKMKVFPARLFKKGDEWEWTSCEYSESPLYDEGVYIVVRINPNVYFTLWGIPFKIYGELVYIGAGIEKFNPVKNEFVVCRDHSNDLLEDVLKNNSNDYAIIHCLYNIPHAESRFLESIWQRESELKRYVVAKCFDYIPGYNILINKRIERKYKSTRLKNFVKMTEEEICKLKNETEQNKSLISVKSRKLLKRLF